MNRFDRRRREEGSVRECIPMRALRHEPPTSNRKRTTWRPAKRNTKLTPSLPFGMEERAGERRRVLILLCVFKSNPSPWPSPRATLRGEGNEALQRSKASGGKRCSDGKGEARTLRT